MDLLIAEPLEAEVLQWLQEVGCPWDEYTCFHAALGGHLEVSRLI